MTGASSSPSSVVVSGMVGNFTYIHPNEQSRAGAGRALGYFENFPGENDNFWSMVELVRAGEVSRTFNGKFNRALPAKAWMQHTVGLRRKP